MKKVLALLLTAIVMVSCNCGETKGKSNKREVTKRIKLVESTITRSEMINLITIDGHLYATSSNGGFVKIEK